MTGALGAVERSARISQQGSNFTAELLLGMNGNAQQHKVEFGNDGSMQRPLGCILVGLLRRIGLETSLRISNGQPTASRVRHVGRKRRSTVPRRFTATSLLAAAEQNVTGAGGNSPGKASFQDSAGGERGGCQKNDSAPDKEVRLTNRQP